MGNRHCQVLCHRVGFGTGFGRVILVVLSLFVFQYWFQYFWCSFLSFSRDLLSCLSTFCVCFIWLKRAETKQKHQFLFNTDKNTSWDNSTFPTVFILFLPCFCFSNNFFFLVISPPPTYCFYHNHHTILFSHSLWAHPCDKEQYVPWQKFCFPQQLEE